MEAHGAVCLQAEASPRARWGTRAAADLCRPRERGLLVRRHHSALAAGPEVDIIGLALQLWPESLPNFTKLAGSTRVGVAWIDLAYAERQRR